MSYLLTAREQKLDNDNTNGKSVVRRNKYFCKYNRMKTEKLKISFFLTKKNLISNCNNDSRRGRQTYKHGNISLKIKDIKE